MTKPEIQRSPERLAVFAGKYASVSTIEDVEAIVDAFPDLPLSVFQEFPKQKRPAWLRSKLRRWRREPVSYPLELLAGGFHRCLLMTTSRRARSRSVQQSLEEFCKVRQIPYHRFQSLHSPEALAEVSLLKPSLGLALSCPILRRTLFGIPTRGTLNLHKSFLPDYRGMPPGFWELHDGTTETGATVHWIDDRLDTGSILCQGRLEIPAYSTPVGLAAQLDLLGTQVLVEAVRAVVEGRTHEVAQFDGPTPNRRPPWLLKRRVERQCARNRNLRLRGSVVARLLKNLIFAAYAILWAPLRNAVLGTRGHARTTVLLYHRVSDAFLDDVTVGVEQFIRQLDLLSSRYEVIDMPTFLESRGKPSGRRRIVITFDDGYQDNLLAARLLKRQGLPATFFLSTGMIGTEQPFPHDITRLGRRVPSLSWEDVRQMARWGFTFGNHTVNHIDCGTAPRQVVLSEIRMAQAELKFALKPQRPLNGFAFPYGRSCNMDDGVRGGLPHEGIEFCCSAGGGTNGPDFDPLDVRRCGVDVEFSLVGFRAVVEGWQPRAPDLSAASRLPLEGDDRPLASNSEGARCGRAARVPAPIADTVARPQQPAI